MIPTAEERLAELEVSVQQLIEVNKDIVETMRLFTQNDGIVYMDTFSKRLDDIESDIEGI